MIQSDMSMLKTLLSMSTSHEKYHFFEKGSVPFSVSAAISSKPVNFGYRCKVS